MKATITQKILAAHCDHEELEPGDMVEARVDMALANDVTAPLAIKVFREIGQKSVFDRDRIALIQDHFVPNKDIPSAQQVKVMRDFARLHRINHFYELGEAGIEHVILPEKGLVLPGDLIIGADSHTCTYGALGAFATGVGSTDLGVAMATGKVWLRVPPAIRVAFKGALLPWVGGKDLILYLLGRLGEDGAAYKTLEFAGAAIEGLPMDDRFTMCNMAVEAGAKNGIIAPDETTRSYVSARTERKGNYLRSDPGARYEAELEIEAGRITPQVAFPHSPANVRPVSDAGRITLDQVFIGSCTNGRIGDLRQAARLLKGRKAAKGVRLIVIPGSPHIYSRALDEGILKIFMDAGAVIGPPTCGPCLGGHMGILAEGEKCLATSNRNFIGRMGHPKSYIYLANPAVAAASAVLGRIAAPEEL